jgi:integrase
MPTVSAQRTPTFTAQQVEKIISAAEGQYRMLYVLLAATGLRIGEAFALEAGHLSDGILTISQGLWNGTLQSPKTSNGFREVDLPANVAEMLKSFLGNRETGFIFRIASGSPLRQVNVLQRSLHPILRSLGLEPGGFHAFRRYRVTHMRKANCPEDLLRFWIGHGDKTVTDRYAKLKQDVEYRKEVAERVGIGFNLEVVPQCPPTFGEYDSEQVIVQ